MPTADATITLTAPATPEGIQSILDRATRLKEVFVTPVPHASSESEIVRFHEKTGAGTRSREALELLPGGDKNGVTPEELAKLMKRDANGDMLDKASARGALRILIVKQDKRIRSGAQKTKILHVNWDDYDTEGAGRYYIEEGARKGLDKHLAAKP